MDERSPRGIGRRQVTWVIRVVLVVALIGAVFLVADRGSDDPGPAGGAASGGTPTTPPAEATPDEFCTAFRAFAAANATYLATLDDASSQALLDSADTLEEMTGPIGMTPGARAALVELIEGTLVDVDPTHDAGGDDVAPDQGAFDAYLQASCPA